MKAGKQHRVPLSRQAVEVLRVAREYADDTGLVFPSATGRALSDNTLTKLLRENGVNSTAHGFPASFRTWAQEEGVCEEVAELCLAHVNSDKTRAAYLVRPEPTTFDVGVLIG